jgi:C2 domain
MASMTLVSACGGGSQGGSGGSGGSAGSAGSGGSAGTVDASGGTTGADAGGTGGGCAPSNCLGCCASGVCQAGTTSVGCGANGAACVTCDRWQECQNQACSVSPSSMWQVIAVSATMAPKSPDGNDWDPLSGLPDVYAKCEIPIGTEKGTTSTKNDTLNPTWNTSVCGATAVSAAMLAGSHAICVFDNDDTPGGDDQAGCWPTNFSDADFAAGAAGHTIQSTLVHNNTPQATVLVLKLTLQ